MVENVTSCLEFRFFHCEILASDTVRAAVSHGSLNTNHVLLSKRML